MFKFWGIIIGVVLLALPAQAVVLLNEADFAAALQKEFVEQGRDENLELEIFGGQTAFVLQDARNARIMISQLKMNDEQGNFTAAAEIFADGNSFASTTLAGKFYVMGEAWVPAEEIAKGEEITEAKLKIMPVRMNRIKDMNVTAKDKLVGMEAKKSLKPGRIVNERDIGPRIIIRKGALVTSVYRSKGLQITAQAVAQEDGAKGQNIELENTKSRKKFSAKVVDAETVEIEVEP